MFWTKEKKNALKENELNERTKKNKNQQKNFFFTMTMLKTMTLDSFFFI